MPVLEDAVTDDADDDDLDKNVSLSWDQVDEFEFSGDHWNEESFDLVGGENDTNASVEEPFDMVDAEDDMDASVDEPTTDRLLRKLKITHVMSKWMGLLKHSHPALGSSWMALIVSLPLVAV